SLVISIHASVSEYGQAKRVVRIDHPVRSERRDYEPRCITVHGSRRQTKRTRSTGRIAIHGVLPVRIEERDSQVEAATHKCHIGWVYSRIKGVLRQSNASASHCLDR